MMNRKKLSHMPYAKAHVNIYDDGSIELISYTTKVITIDCQGWLTCTGTYSQSTRKHISAFMAEYGLGLSYYTAKSCYEKNESRNIYTGEVKSLADGE